MKRFRIFGVDFDARAHSLTVEIQDHWEENIKQLHRRNRKQTEDELIWEFGEASAGQKRQNFIDLGPKPISILAFHNKFFQQIRISFVMGAYYPALTASCVLGERILNYLILTLRDEFKTTAEYKRVYNKDSFDNWDIAIDTLEAWNILLPGSWLSFASYVIVGTKRSISAPRSTRATALWHWVPLEVSGLFLAISSVPSVHSLGLSLIFRARSTLRRAGRIIHLSGRFMYQIAWRSAQNIKLNQLYRG